MNVYDFDKTIYNGDSTVDFYFFCLRKKPMILLRLPKQIVGYILYKLRLKDKAYFKEKFYSFLSLLPNIEILINDFWQINNTKICDWYLKQKKSTDIIISASPEFLLKPLEKRLKIERVIASKVDIHTGILLSKNCYGKEKVQFFKEIYKNKKIDNFYSDSLSDKPLAMLAKNSYLVNNKNKKFRKYKIEK